MLALTNGKTTYINWYRYVLFIINWTKYDNVIIVMFGVIQLDSKKLRVAGTFRLEATREVLMCFTLKSVGNYISARVHQWED